MQVTECYFTIFEITGRGWIVADSPTECSFSGGREVGTNEILIFYVRL